MADNSMKQRTNARFKTQPALEVGATELPEFEASADAIEDKIARLKKLRLARDAAALAAPPQAVAAKKKPGRKKKRAPVSPAVSLSDWLKSQLAGGHNS